MIFTFSVTLIKIWVFIWAIWDTVHKEWQSAVPLHLQSTRFDVFCAHVDPETVSELVSLSAGIGRGKMGHLVDGADRAHQPGWSVVSKIIQGGLHSQRRRLQQHVFCALLALADQQQPPAVCLTHAGYSSLFGFRTSLMYRFGFHFWDFHFWFLLLWQYRSISSLDLTSAAIRSPANTASVSFYPQVSPLLTVNIKGTFSQWLQVKTSVWLIWV